MALEDTDDTMHFQETTNNNNTTDEHSTHHNWFNFYDPQTPSYQYDEHDARFEYFRKWSKNKNIIKVPPHMWVPNSFDDIAHGISETLFVSYKGPSPFQIGPPSPSEQERTQYHSDMESRNLYILLRNVCKRVAREDLVHRCEVEIQHYDSMWRLYVLQNTVSLCSF